MIIEKLLSEISLTFEVLKIPYMLTGSLAFNVYAVPRATRDIDLIIEMQEKDIDVFIKHIDGVFYYNKKTIKEEIKRKGLFNIIHFESGYKIDLIIRSNDMFEENKFANRKRISILNTDVYVITAEDLIISKLRWIQRLESDLQKQDIEALLKRPQTNIEYVRHWCGLLKLKTFNLIDNEQ